MNGEEWFDRLHQGARYETICTQRLPTEGIPTEHLPAYGYRMLPPGELRRAAEIQREMALAGFRDAEQVLLCVPIGIGDEPWTEGVIIGVAYRGRISLSGQLFTRDLTALQAAGWRVHAVGRASGIWETIEGAQHLRETR